MYQFYYADESAPLHHTPCQKQVSDVFTVTAIRPAVWEEHCLECSAPLCFQSCAHYQARSDGRCKRFENGLRAFRDDKACCGKGVRVTFRKWANMMTVIFPSMLSPQDYADLFEKNEKRGRRLKRLADSKLPQTVRWQGIRTVEFIRRKRLGSGVAEATTDAFVFHGYSYHPETFRLILEVFDDHTSVFRTAMTVTPGENLHVLPRNELSDACQQAGFLVKIYPENDVPAEMDVLWCDFVKGAPVVKETPAAQVKCVVWDLDNTVWDGTYVETDDPRTLVLKDDVAHTMKALDERGILQSVASKNDYEQVYPLLERHGIAQYFLYPQIHWGPKSGSIEQIANSLNIGIDALALVDDSVFEREQVSSVYPQVRVYDAAEIPALLSYPECDVMVTAESRNRRAMYRAEEARRQIMQNGQGDVTAFLRECRLCAAVFVPQSEEQITRCYELVLRTNQLNMSGKKYTREEFESVLVREGHTCFGVSCRDQFGDYGIVGFGQYRTEEDLLVFTEFAMSCRVAGKYVESALFTYLLEKEGCTAGRFAVIKTKKNGLLRHTLQEIGFETQTEDTENVLYTFGRGMKNADIVTVCEG